MGHFYAVRKYQAAVFGIGHASGTGYTTLATRLPGDMVCNRCMAVGKLTPYQLANGLRHGPV